MTKSKLYSYFNYFFIAIVLLWQPLQGTVLTFDGKGRLLLLLTVMAFVLNCNRHIFKKLLFSKPIVLWLVWCIYVTINTYFHGFRSENLSFSFFIVNQVFCPCIIMAVSAYEYMKNARRLLKVMLWSFLIYAFIGAFVMDIGYVAMDEGAVNVNTLGNALALNVMMIIFFAGVLYCRKEITLKTTIVLVLFAIGIVVISATRKALGAGVIMIIALMLSQMKLTFGSFVKMILPVVVLYYGLIFVMGNTQMGERFADSEEKTSQFVDQYNVGNNPFLKMVGDRAPQYVQGTQLFIEHPITGVGLTNFQKETKYPYRLHTEYMVQICECGIIGCVLFVMFYVVIIKRLLGYYKRDYTRSLAIVMSGGVVVLLFIYLTAWSYSMCFYFAVLGTIVGFISNCNIKCSKR